MKKRSIKNLKLNKESISNIQTTIFGGAESGGYCETWNSYLNNSCPIKEEPLPLTAEAHICPDNSLYGGCSLGHCVETFWCPL